MHPIADYIRQIAQNTDTSLVAATVDEVSGRTCKVTPVGGGAPIANVRLNAKTEGDKGLVITPAQGSVVLIGKRTETDWVALMCSEVDKVEVVVGGASWVQTGNGFTLKTQEASLKSFLTSLLDALLQLTVTTGVGPSGTPINAPAFTNLKTQLNNLLEE